MSRGKGDKPEFAERTCLKCYKKFKSKGAGNRVCEKCNTENKTLSSRNSKSTGFVDGEV